MSISQIKKAAVQHMFSREQVVVSTSDAEVEYYDCEYYVTFVVGSTEYTLKFWDDGTLLHVYKD